MEPKVAGFKSRGMDGIWLCEPYKDKAVVMRKIIVENF